MAEELRRDMQFKKIIFAFRSVHSSRTLVRQAVFPVPGAPQMYKLPGVEPSSDVDTNSFITDNSFSRPTKSLGMELWRTYDMRDELILLVFILIEKIFRFSHPSQSFKFSRTLEKIHAPVKLLTLWVIYRVP